MLSKWIVQEKFRNQKEEVITEEVNVLCICKKIKPKLLINKYIKNYNSKQVLSKQLEKYCN